MFILGLILLILGIVFAIHVLFVIGLILLIVGACLFAWSAMHGGTRYY